MTRLPALGPRGEGWVGIQFLLLGLLAVAGFGGGAWTGAARIATTAAGIPLAVAGLVLLRRGVADLGRNLTPNPRPRDDGELVESGIYARVRHPIYGGLVVVAVAWGLLTASPPALVLAAALLGFFVLKARREEAWLVARFPGYPAYRGRTRRLIPWLL
ncbi:MAG: hypothetical protein RL338_493 [Chloroflexota bacterium]